MPSILINWCKCGKHTLLAFKSRAVLCAEVVEVILAVDSIFYKYTILDLTKSTSTTVIVSWFCCLEHRWSVLCLGWCNGSLEHRLVVVFILTTLGLIRSTWFEICGVPHTCTKRDVSRFVRHCELLRWIQNGGQLCYFVSFRLKV